MSSREISELEFITLEQRCARLMQERDQLAVELEAASAWIQQIKHIRRASVCISELVDALKPFAKWDGSVRDFEFAAIEKARELVFHYTGRRLP